MLVSVCKGFKKSPHIEPFLEPIKRGYIWTSHPKLEQHCPLPSIPASTVAKGGQFGESNAPNLRASRHGCHGTVFHGRTMSPGIGKI